jgi:NAD(P)-dependent dehydrogenase (short-subunit alcohol dehydrogenase family)
MKLAGSVALVTGASRGIGKAIALALARAGADVACAATRAENARATVDEILALGRKAVALGAQVERADDVTALVRAATEALGLVDILVNNAGISNPKPVLEMSEADWDQTFDINAKGAFLCAQAVARRLAEGKRPGVVLNIGSIAGVNAFPRRLTYCSSKAALHQMTKVMAIEWAPLGIRVNCLAPGYIHSDITEGLSQRGLLDLGALRRRIPQGELGRAEDIASAAVYLCSEEARYLTGSIVNVDGGWLAYGFT